MSESMRLAAALPVAEGDGKPGLSWVVAQGIPGRSPPSDTTSHSLLGSRSPEPCE